MLPARIHRLIARALVAVWLQAAGLPLFIAAHFDADDIAIGGVVNVITPRDVFRATPFSGTLKRCWR